MTRISLGDISLHVVQRGTGRPLLLVHGFPLDHRMWDGQLGGLAEDFHVIAPDLRGFGASDAGGGVVLMEQFADDLARLLDALAIRQPVILCGLSMGGYIAWQFWRRHADRLSHLILCDTRAAADTPELAAARLETAARVLREGTGLLVESMLPKLFSEHTRTRNHSLITAAARMIESTRPEGAAAALRGMAQRADATAWLGAIRLPTLVVCGQHDAISGTAEMRALADALPCAEFAVIPGCGHLAPWEDPIHVNRVVRQFLAAPRPSPRHADH